MPQNEQYTVIVLDSAKDDMLNITSHFVMFGSIQGAKRIREKFAKGREQLSLFPYSAPAIRDPKLERIGIRVLVIENYLMIYKVFDDEKKVLVYRVIDGRQDYYATMKAYNEEFT